MCIFIGVSASPNRPVVKKKRASPQKRSTRKKQQSKVPVRLLVVLAGLLLILFSPLYYGLVLKGLSSTWRWIRDYGEDPNYRSYKNFSTNIPGRYSIHGIDVSYYQGKINWEKVREMKDEDVSIKFAFIKATEGLMKVDPYFQRNWREAPKAGIVCGAYHYFKPSKSGKWQARFFLQNVRAEKGDLPMVVDIEELNGTEPEAMRKELMAFLKHVESKTGIRPLIYTNIVFYRDYLRGYVDDYYLWIAHYYKKKLHVAKGTPWKFWQHTDKATVSGINHVVDMNIFKGDSAEFERLLIK